MSMMKIERSGSESGSGSISKRRGSADLDPDPHQNVMDPQHYFTGISGMIGRGTGKVDPELFYPIRILYFKP